MFATEFIQDTTLGGCAPWSSYGILQIEVFEFDEVSFEGNLLAIIHDKRFP